MDRGSVVKLMFLAHGGAVFGTAEMLPSLTWVQQPFRFVRLHRDDQSRLQAAVQGWLEHNRHDNQQIRLGHQQMEKNRAW